MSSLLGFLGTILFYAIGIWITTRFIHEKGLVYLLGVFIAGFMAFFGMAGPFLIADILFDDGIVKLAQWQPAMPAERALENAARLSAYLGALAVAIAGIHMLFTDRSTA